MRIFFAAAGFACCTGFLMDQALATRPSRDFSISVHYDRTDYALALRSNLLTYKEGARTYRMPLKSCNQATIERISSSYRHLSASYKAQPLLPRTKYDVQVISAGIKSPVARGSRYGTWLRDLPKKIMYVDAEAQVACKR